MQQIGGWMLSILRAPDDAKLAERIQGDVRQLCEEFPVPAAGA